MRRKQIVIQPYNQNWPNIFATEAKLIGDNLKNNALNIEHIGSTSIPGLCAKEDIDILCQVSDLDDAANDLIKAGYTFKGELNIPLRYYFSKNTSCSKVNLHVCPKEHPFATMVCKFRDYIKSNKNALKQYAELKLKLIADPKSHLVPKGKFSNYNCGKYDFIMNILKNANFKQAIVKFCMHQAEWQAANNLRQEFYQGIGIADIIEQPMAQSDDNKHLILYLGTDIIGYCHLHFLGSSSATIKVLQIREDYKDWFLDFCNSWATIKGFKIN